MCDWSFPSPDPSLPSPQMILFPISVSSNRVLPTSLSIENRESESARSRRERQAEDEGGLTIPSDSW